MILLPTKGEIEWTSVEAKHLRDFLQSETGQKLLALCDIQTPALLDGTDVNKTLVSSGERKGFESLMEYILGLIIAQPASAPPVSQEYPDLNDDTKWEDNGPTPENQVK